jgi:hypothetical protein
MIVAGRVTRMRLRQASVFRNPATATATATDALRKYAGHALPAGDDAAASIHGHAHVAATAAHRSGVHKAAGAARNFAAEHDATAAPTLCASTPYEVRLEP